MGREYGVTARRHDALTGQGVNVSSTIRSDVGRGYQRHWLGACLLLKMAASGSLPGKCQSAGEARPAMLGVAAIGRSSERWAGCRGKGAG